MFAYCGNNPVIRKDPTGHVFVHIAPIRASEDTATPHTTGTSDGNKMSNELLQHILEKFDQNDYPFETTILYVSVEYSGIYNNCRNAVKDGFLLALGLLAGYTPIPGATLIGGALDAYSIYDYASSFSDTFPDGEYHQYTVTFTWTNTTAPVGFSDYMASTKYQLRVTYVWNDTNLRSPSWQWIAYEYRTVD